MPDPFLLIDGYNLMHAVGMFRQRYGPGEFEKWRNRFLHYLSGSLTPRERERTTVVFDAPSTDCRQVQQMESHSLLIMFAEGDLEADDVLEELIAAHSAPRQILLVSSDHRLQKAVRRRRGKPIDSEDFAAQLERRRHDRKRRKPDGPPRCKFTGVESEAELQAWMKIFGDIPEAEQLRGGQQRTGSRTSTIEDLQREIDAITE